MVLGIDISHHNKLEDVLGLLDDSGDVGFVISKASEGRTFKDCKFDSMVGSLIEKHYKDNSIILGAYHFARPDNGNTAESEAANFLSCVSRYLDMKIPMILALDIEGKAANKKYGEWYKSWLNTVSNATGINPIIYVGEKHIGALPISLRYKYGLWLARWRSDVRLVEDNGEWTLGVGSYRPDAFPWETWAFWQYACGEGLKYPIDRNIFNGSFEQLKLYATSEYWRVSEDITEICDCKCGCCQGGD